MFADLLEGADAIILSLPRAMTGSSIEAAVEKQESKGSPSHALSTLSEYPVVVWSRASLLGKTNVSNPPAPPAPLVASADCNPIKIPAASVSISLMRCDTAA
jgi:hypothetical protein